MLPARYKALTSSVFPGGFGAVQPVQDTFLDRQVLFKSMKDASDRDQLLNEIRGLSNARSRHVVEIYDVISSADSEVIGIIIEYLTGRDYLKFHQEIDGDRTQFPRILYQVAVALKDMHAAKIIHRDIKLENIKCSASGLLKVFDFGISCASEAYRTKHNRGTYDYAGPELYVANAELTTAFDIYAWGICAWKLATAILPPELRDRPPQKSSRPPSISTAVAWLPAPLVDLIDRSLAPNPADRPSAAEVVESFGRHLVRNLHRGLFIKEDAVVFELSSEKPTVKISFRDIGSISCRYDGLTFSVTAVEGNVYLNNASAEVNAILPSSCCITFGEEAKGGARRYVTFASSHPEVIL